MALAGVLLLAGVAACGGTADPDEHAGHQPEPTDTLVTATTKPAMVSPPMKRLTAAQVVAGLKRAGYGCATELSYVICRSAPVEVWVLTGKHPRPPVISLRANGSLGPARKAIGDRLGGVLQAAHVNEMFLVADWYRRQQDSSSASRTIGDWQVELSAEQDSDEPGVHLTLTDKLCKQACQAE